MNVPNGPPGSGERVVIDTDPGIDDVVTLVLAARSPEIDVAAVTTTYGNAPLALTTRNARHVLGLCGRPDVPVHPGSDRPLERALVTAPETHGETGVGYAPVPDPPAGETTPLMPNPTALLDVLRAQPEPVTLVTLGPLTNLAHALRTDRSTVHASVRRHIGMFGNLHERGNTNRWADFNAWCDPEAVVEVFRNGPRCEMVGLDVTRRMIVTRGEVERLASSPDPVVRWLTDALRFYVDFHSGEERLDGCVVNDVLTVGELLHPGLLDFQTYGLKIVTRDDEERGRTVESADGDHVRAALDIDAPAMHRLLDRVFGRDWDREGGT